MFNIPRNSNWILSASLAIFLAATAARPAAAQKFRADDPLRADDDATVHVSQIEKHKLNDYYDFLQHTFSSPAGKSRRGAVNVNTLGEVPDSTWFQNRHGAARMTDEALVRGPNAGNGPSMDAPWLVIEAKTEGITPGFRIRDARGDVYVIKFDPPENPEMATAAEAISTRFFHAIGYNVPENYIAFFRRDQLRIDKKTRVTDATGRSRSLSESDLDAILFRVHKSGDGTYRVLASKFLKGTPIGPFQYFGTRPDDPNDVFAHEHRRELRGLRVFSAWLNHDDSRAINTLDMLVETNGTRFVKHYLIDFGSTLGSGSVGAQKPRAGWEYTWEPSAVLGRIASFGLWDRKWVRTVYPDYPSIGRFESKDFEPQNWKPEYPNPAFVNADDEDSYWAAKIVMAFTTDQIRAIVKTGRLSDPAAEEYLVQTLAERRDKIGKYWMTRLSSFDEFRIERGELKFQHLAASYDFAPRPAYEVNWYRFDNTNGGRTLIEKYPPQEDGYFVAVICSIEGNVEVFIRNRNGRSEIVGVER